MVTIMEANGELLEGKIVVCYECGEEWESFNPHSSEGDYELCDDCCDD